MQEIKKEIQNLLVAAGVKGEIQLTVPPNSVMGDFAFACFGVGKEWGMSPKDAADKIKGKIKDKKLKLVVKIETAGPYLNFYLNPGAVADLVIKQISKQGKKYGDNKSGKNKKVLIEYPSNNTHKEFHIGHFRNVAIGNTLVRLYEKNGYKIYPVNYLNDFGNHVAKCLWGLNKFHKNEKPPENKQKWLGDIYAEASQAVRDNPDFGKEVAEVQKKLEERDPDLWPLFMETREWSIEKFQEIFQQLGVEHKAVFYEKDLKDKGQKMVDDLLLKGVAEIGEGGAVIIDLSKYNLDIALLRKSNGAGLYLTSDLPLAVAKFKKFNVDESIVVTGTEQNFYFKQLYKILEIIGFKKKLTHIGYGLVNLKEGKMSSRLGNVILYEDLYDEVFEKLKIESKQRHADWSEKEINKIAHVLSMAALKFDMLKHEAAKNIVFDTKEATAVDGFTGPYVLYVVARINSILEKAKHEKIKGNGDFKLLNNIEEKQLLLFLSKYEEVVLEALREYNPSTITRYCFDLAQKFNDFYAKHSVLNAESKDLVGARLQLSGAVRNVLENALGLLTIDTLEQM
jgi:arginyl-tRNA synthetase